MAQYDKLLIGGRWVAGDNGTSPVMNPATEQEFATAPEASVAQADEAAAAAAAALPAWSRTTLAERTALLAKVAQRLPQIADELIPTLVAETGATLQVATGMQIPVGTERFTYYSGVRDADLVASLPPITTRATALAPSTLMNTLINRAPVGVVACISPYNFPLVNMAGKIAPALAAGNTVVMKAPVQDPLAIIELARICDEVGFPPGVVNVITSAAPGPGVALTESKHVDMISFTGSTNVGKAIYAAGAPTMKRMLLELGGKGACIVFDDGDVEAAVKGLMSTWTFHSGQICTAPTRAVLHRSVYDEVISRLSAAAGYLKVGPPMEATTVIGPVISGAQRDRIESFISGAKAEGGTVVLDGTRPEGPGLDTGYYAGPTLIADCTAGMRVMQEEVFGPVIAAAVFDTEDEAIAIANDSEFGLYNYVYSRDTARAMAVAKQLRCGQVGINTVARHPETPFGGFKMSGIGRDGGLYGLHCYTEIQDIVWPG